jgi:hypothetical protein
MNILLTRIRALAFFALLWGAWFDAAVCGRVEALSAQKKTVLVLYGEPLSVPANRMTEQGLTAGLSREHAGGVEIFSEYLDFTRFPRAQYEDVLVRYLRARYATRKPDVPYCLPISENSSVGDAILNIETVIHASGICQKTASGQIARLDPCHIFAPAPFSKHPTKGLQTART